MRTEILLMWAAVYLYAAGAVFYVIALVFRKPKMSGVATWVSMAGLLPQAVAFGVRWVRIGRGPSLGYFEMLSSLAFFSVLMFGLLALRYRSVTAAGIFVMPIAFLLLGAAMFSPTSELELTGTLASWWLAVHVTFAKLAYGCLSIAFALAVAFLIRGRGGPDGGAWGKLLARLPAQDILDDLSFKFAAAGFVFLGIMVLAGAIWANESWGRYWAWDPIETWSLISWLVYAVALHLRLTRGWHGTRWAWLAAGALPVVLFALAGVPIVYRSIHAGYLTG